MGETPLFFASCDEFRKLFNPETDPKRVEIHFHSAEICDYSALHAINAVAQRYKKIGTEVSLQTSNLQSVRHVSKAKDLLKTIQVDTSSNDIIIKDADESEDLISPVEQELPPLFEKNEDLSKKTGISRNSVRIDYFVSELQVQTPVIGLPNVINRGKNEDQDWNQATEDLEMSSVS